MHNVYSSQQDPHGDRFSLRNPVMAVWVAMLWMLVVLTLGAEMLKEAPRALVLASRLLMYAALALGVVHVVIGGLRDLRRAGPDAPRGFRYHRRSLTAGWLFCLVAALLAFTLKPFPDSAMQGTAVIFGAAAVAGMILQLILSRRKARDY